MTILGAGVLFWHDARADEQAAQLDFVYEAPVECPSRPDIERQLRERVPLNQFRGADARRFVVVIVRDADGEYSGRLEVRRSGREPEVREIRATTCRAVSSALTVFLAMALDPSAEERELVSPPAPRAGDSSSAGSLTSTRPSMPTRPLMSTGPSSASSPALRARARSGASWIWSSGFHASLLQIPTPAWGGRVYAEVARRPAHGSVGVAVRLSWGWSDFTRSPPRAGEAEFRLRIARVEGCAPVAVSPFVVSPCAAVDLGTLVGRVPELARTTTTTSRWTALGAILRGSWAVSAMVSIELQAGLFIPLKRSLFVLVDPYRVVYQTPAIVFEAGAGGAISTRFY